MRTAIVVLFVLTALVGTSCDSDGCTSIIHYDEAFATVLGDARRQPVFGGSKFVGWRIYGLDPKGPLARAGILNSALLTHICGVPADQLLEPKATICCVTDASREVGVTFRLSGNRETTVQVPRQPP